MRPIKVLLIEDNPDNQQLARWILEDAHYTVIPVYTAEEGFNLLRASSFDIVLMDISLPGMNGKEATKKIRDTPEICDIPVLALTAHAVQGERESIMDSGVDCILTKPVNEDELLAVIKSLLKTN